MEAIVPTDVLYIRLGKKGIWARECIDEGILRLDYREVPHQICLDKKWDEVRGIMRTVVRNGHESAAASHETQIRYFYESDSKLLWITFHGDRLYWCFSDQDISQWEDDNTKTRPANWHCEDIRGEPLHRTFLRGDLLAVAGFQGTICRPGGGKYDRVSRYIIDKINAVTPVGIEETKHSVSLLEANVAKLIQGLTWKDFEILVDLIFRQTGWQRLGVLGENEPGIDLDLYSPITEERFAVQIKSRAGADDLQGFEKYIQETSDYARAYFVVHSPRHDLRSWAGRVELLQVADIARLAVRFGLTDWITKKSF